MPTADVKLDIDSIQGTAVLLLDSQGESEAAELLEIGQLNYRLHETVVYDILDPFSTDSRGRQARPGPPTIEPMLFVDPHLLDHYTEDVVPPMSDAVARVLQMEGYPLRSLSVMPKRVQGDWRAARQQERLSGINNQAHRQPLDKPHPVKDGLHFRDNAEVLVYDALVALAESRPKSEPSPSRSTLPFGSPVGRSSRTSS